MDPLKETIYPFAINSLHYFAITGNIEAILYCFENGVPY